MSEEVNTGYIDVLVTNNNKIKNEKSIPVKLCYSILGICESIGECLVGCLGLDDSVYQEHIENMTEKELKYAKEVNEKREMENKVLSEYSSPLTNNNNNNNNNNNDNDDDDLVVIEVYEIKEYKEDVNINDNSIANTIDDDFDVIKNEEIQNCDSLDTVPLVSKDNIDNKSSSKQEEFN